MAVRPQIITDDRASGAQVIDGSFQLAQGDGTTKPYLTRTNSSSGNRRTWTFSGWVKRTRVNNTESDTIINYANSATSASSIEFGDYDSHDMRLRFNSFDSGNNMDLWSAASYRDLGSWYHIVEIYDSTEATDTNRVKMYVNGNYITNWAAASYPTNRWPGQNDEGPFCYAGSPGGYICAYYWSTAVSSWKGNFLASQFYLLDGSIAAPEDFGFTDPLTGVWRPKKYEVKAPNRVGKFFSTNFAASDGFQSAHPKLNAFNGGFGTVDVGRSACSSSGCTITLSSIDVTVNHKLEIWSGYGSASVNGGTAVNYDSSAPAWQNLSFTGALSSIAITGASGVSAGELYAVRVDGVILLDNGGYGTTGFYLPFDGNSPIGEDKSGSGNDWTPHYVNAANVIPKATGALPILNTVSGGKVASAGVRTDTSGNNCVLALPLVGIADDVSNQINSTSTTKTVTTTNAVGVSTISNFYGGSYYFDGSGDYLSVTESTDWLFEEGDFTIEFWAYIRSVSTDGSFVTNMDDFNSSAQYNSRFVIGLYSSEVRVWLADDGDHVLHDYDPPELQWVHYAVTRESGNSFTLYKNGVNIFRATQTCDLDTNGPLLIGYLANLGTYNGYIQDLRLYKGTAKYISNFIPASTSPHVLPDTPSGVAYSSDLTKVTDGAVAFDGSGDYLSLAASSDFDLAGDFCIEAWVYRTTTDNFQTIIDTRSDTSTGWLFWVNDSGTVKLTLNTARTSEFLASDRYLTNNCWQHVAMVRSGSATNNCKMYINGFTVAQGTNTSTWDGSAAAIGYSVTSGHSMSYWRGNISNLRLVNGSAVYTTEFTPSSTPLTNVTNTKLLCCQSNSSAIVAEVSPGTITANGDVAPTTFNPFPDNINTVRGKSTGYPTWNPLQISSAGAGTFTNGNLTWYSSGAWKSTTASLAVNSGKWYYEQKTVGNMYGTASGNTALCFGWCKADTPLTDEGFVDNSTQRERTTAFFNTGGYVNFGAYQGTVCTPATGDIMATALDMDNKTIKYYLNNVEVISETLGNTTSELVPYTQGYYVDSYFESNFGQKPFKFPPPEGFQPLNYADLPSAAVVTPDQYVGVTTYVGSGDGTTYNNAGLKFKADMTWFKRYDGTINHVLYDSVRGYGVAANALRPNTNDDEGAFGDSVVNTKSNGFSVTGSNTTGINGSGEDIVCWAWKAGGNSNTFNKDGVGYANASDLNMDVGALNSESYTEDAVYSGGVSVSSGSFGGGEEATKGFDGKTSTKAKTTANGATITIAFSPAISVSSLLRVRTNYTNGSGSGISVNGTSYGEVPTASDGQYVTINGFRGSLTSIALSAGGSVNAAFSIVEVDGKILVDSDQTPPDAPSIAPTACSIGTAQGFSIIKYTGTGNASDTIATGLDRAIDFYIVKPIDATGNWNVASKAMGLQYSLVLNSDVDKGSASLDYWNSSEPTDILLSIGTADSVNKSGDTFIMYAWANVPGLQKAGSYEGNNSTDGPYVDLGFKPAIVMIKNIDATADWVIYDDSRDPVNPGYRSLYPDTTASQNTTSTNNEIDFLSNGFKLRNDDTVANDSNTYVYMAWAKVPLYNLYGAQSDAR